MENKIRYYRTMNQMSQEELGKVIGVTGAAISSWEKNRTEPNVSQSIQLSRLFGCSLDQLFGATTTDYYNPEHNAIIESYKNADEMTKTMVQRLLKYDKELNK